jgi:hypothetical protein
MNDKFLKIYNVVKIKNARSYISDCDFYVLSSEELDEFSNAIVNKCCNIVQDSVDQREPASTYVDKIKNYFKN